MTITITPCHITNKSQVRTINFTNNLQIRNLILLTTTYPIGQSTSLVQFNCDLLSNQVFICSLNRQTTKQQHKYHKITLCE